MSGGLGFALNFLMTLSGSIYEVEASICTFRSIKKEGMYVRCSETRGGGIGGNGLFHNGKYGMRIPIEIPKLLLSTMLE